MLWCKFETKEEKTRTKRLVLRILTCNKKFQVKYGVQIYSINGIVHGLKFSGLLKKAKLILIPTKF